MSDHPVVKVLDYTVYRVTFNQIQYVFCTIPAYVLSHLLMIPEN